MTLAEQFEKAGEKRGLKKGRKEGRQEGMQKGVQQGEATLLMRLIKRRFGEIPFAYAQRLKSADAETLLLWGERVLDAATIEDIFS